jgi:hypothetical protein
VDWCIIVRMDIAEETFDPSWSVPEFNGAVHLESPYSNPLGTAYLENPVGVPDGRCPLCSNSRHAEIDEALMSGMPGKVRSMGFSNAEIDMHLALHIGDTYTRILTPILEASGVPAANPGDFPQVDARLERVRALRDEFSSGIVPGLLAGDDGVNGFRALAYAMDGGTQVGALRPWTVGRTALEVRVREADAINFYDEMLDVRQRARDIYGLIVGEKDENGEFSGGYATGKTVYDPESGKPIYMPGDPKLLGIAVQSVKEMSRVVEVLGKSALIAKRLGEGSGAKELDPGLKAIIDGISSRSALAPPGQALPAGQAEALRAEEERMTDNIVAAGQAVPDRVVDAEDPDADPS